MAQLYILDGQPNADKPVALNVSTMSSTYDSRIVLEFVSTQTGTSYRLLVWESEALQLIRTLSSELDTLRRAGGRK